MYTYVYKIYIFFTLAARDCRERGGGILHRVFSRILANEGNVTSPYITSARRPVQLRRDFA